MTETHETPTSRIKIPTVAKILGVSKSWVYKNWNDLALRYNLTVVKLVSNGHPQFIRSEIENVGIKKMGGCHA